MNLTAAIGKNIRYYRLLKSLKLETLAKQIEISKATMSQIENGQVEITISRIEKIAKVLDIEYTALITIKSGSITILNKPLNQEPAGYNLNVDKTIIEKLLSLTEEMMKLNTKLKVKISG
ncbi:MAG: helix-turn-helix transcriptional regulator [Agriterribacter sp.]